VEQVGDFLETIGLAEEHRRRFLDEEIDGRALCQATDADLTGEPFKLPFGPRKTLVAEIGAQLRYAQVRERHQHAHHGVVLVKGASLKGPQISADALERIRNWHLDPATGYRGLRRRTPPLTDDELACWQYQADWLVCPITGKAWARGDVVSTMGVALYHAPRFCSERERQRRPLEEEQARRSDAARKARMDHSGTSFERDYEAYPTMEPPPLVNLPASAGSAAGPFDAPQHGGGPEDAERLAKLKIEASGLKSRSRAVQQQMFEGLDQGSEGRAGMAGEEDVQRALDQLKQEPSEEQDLERKLALYESYFSGVDGLRRDLFELWERGRVVLAPGEVARMGTALRGIDRAENLSIPERSRFWFVYHMMSQASRNHSKMQRVLDELEDLFEAACDRPGVGASEEELSEDPPLGSIEVVIGPAFDIDAYNDGINGNPSIGVLPAADRGVLDMDRQYNAVNFQFYVQRTAAGVTREGAEVSFERKLCTSRLSFYLEESHGSRVFPKNIISQLSLLFYRRNDALRLPDGNVNERRVAVCVRKAIPRLLRAITVDIFHGDASHSARVEEGVRLYLAVHQVAIKLLATFQTSFKLLFNSVVEWIQQPFTPKSDTEWPDLEELLLGASLCSMPWPLLREAFVRKLFVLLLGGTTRMGAAATARQRAEHLLSQNRSLLGRLAYILAFFEAGPGKLPVGEMDLKYSRCAGTLPKADREALVAAATERAGAGSLVELWATLACGVQGMLTTMRSSGTSTNLFLMSRTTSLHGMRHHLLWSRLRVRLCRWPPLSSWRVSAPKLVGPTHRTGPPGLRDRGASASWQMRSNALRRSHSTRAIPSCHRRDVWMGPCATIVSGGSRAAWRFSRICGG